MFKMEVQYRGSDGREYPDAGSMIRSSMSRMLQDKWSELERAVSGSVCPAHGESATVSRQNTAEGVDFKIEACCDEHAKRAREAGQRAIAV
jgi:hypothetical protein